MQDAAGSERFFCVKVWDATLRVCHWWIALSTLLMLALGTLLFFHKPLNLSKSLTGTLTDLHAMVGFFLAAGLLIRIAYLLQGAYPANWRDLLPHTKRQLALGIRTLRYYLSGFKGECPIYLGHNPLAGVAYTGFFLLLMIQVVAGSAIYLLGEETMAAYAHGTEAHGAEKWPPEWLETLHITDAILILLFIAAHLGALVVHELVERRGLISSMVSGNKFFSEAERQVLIDSGDFPSENEARE